MLVRNAGSTSSPAQFIRECAADSGRIDGGKVSLLWGLSPGTRVAVRVERHRFAGTEPGVQRGADRGDAARLTTHGEIESYQVTSSTLRFLALPSSALLEETGAYKPHPKESSRFAAIEYLVFNSFTTVAERRRLSSRLEAALP